MRPTATRQRYAFTVRLNGTVLATAEGTDSFPSLTADTTITKVGFSGSGALDDFVARTTDPFIADPSFLIGGEGYATLEDAAADAPDEIPALAKDVTLPTAPAAGESLNIKLNDHTLSFASGTAVAVAAGDVTTYTADDFPRTATAGQDGTAANPYEIADVDDIAALKAAFAANANWRSKNYKLVADIDVASLGYWDGIGTQNTANSGLTTATFDGAGHTISNLSFDNASNPKYRGFFYRADNSVIKDLSINVAGFKDTDAVEH